MDCASLPDLDSLDRDALVVLFRTQHERQQELDAMLRAREQELRHLEAELEAHRHTLSEQADELRSRSERIEHLKLMVAKYRHMIFGTRSEKIVLQLEQLELELEEHETAQAEAEAFAERISPENEPKTRPERKPLAEHLEREVVTHVPASGCCPDCGGALRHFGEDVSEQRKRTSSPS